MFTAVLFTTAKTWKQPMCPSIDEWLKESDIYIMEYCSIIKMKEILIFATRMDLEDIMLSEIHQRKTNIYDVTYM